MDDFYARQQAACAAQDVNRLALEALLQLGRQDVGVAAAVFRCRADLVRQLLEWSATSNGRLRLEALAAAHQSLFRLELNDTLELEPAPLTEQELRRRADPLRLRRLNAMVLFAAGRAAVSDEAALLALHLTPPVADMLRSTPAETLFGTLEAADWSLASPRFSPGWLQLIGGLDARTLDLVPHLVAILADEQDVRPLHAAHFNAASERRRARFVDCDHRLVQLARHAGRSGATTQVAEVMFGQEAQNTAVRAILRAQLKQRRETRDKDAHNQPSWTKNVELRLVGSALALMMVRLIRAGFSVAEATLYAYEHHRLLCAQGEDQRHLLRLRDAVLNLMVPLLNRRAKLQRHSETASAWVVLDAFDGDYLYGLVPPQVSLARRRPVEPPPVTRAAAPRCPL